MAHTRLEWRLEPAEEEGAGRGWGAEDVDVLLPADAPLPHSAERTVDAAALTKMGAGGFMGKRLLLTLCERVAPGESDREAALFARLAPLGDVLLRTNPETLEPERGVAVTLKFTFDDSALLTVTYKDWVSEREDDLRRHNQRGFLGRNLGKITMGLVLLLAAGSQGYGAWQDMRRAQEQEAYRFTARKAALTQFYKAVNPDKISGIDEALEAHKGKETALWRKLEKKYDRRPPRPEFLKYSAGPGNGEF